MKYKKTGNVVVVNILKIISVKFQTIHMKNDGVIAMCVQESRKIPPLWCESLIKVKLDRYCANIAYLATGVWG